MSLNMTVFYVVPKKPCRFSVIMNYILATINFWAVSSLTNADHWARLHWCLGTSCLKMVKRQQMAPVFKIIYFSCWVSNYRSGGLESIYFFTNCKLSEAYGGGVTTGLRYTFQKHGSRVQKIQTVSCWLLWLSDQSWMTRKWDKINMK